MYGTPRKTRLAKKQNLQRKSKRFNRLSKNINDRRRTRHKRMHRKHVLKMKKSERIELKAWLKKMHSRLTAEISSKTYLLKLVEREQDALQQLDNAEMTVKEEKKG